MQKKNRSRFQLRFMQHYEWLATRMSRRRNPFLHVADRKMEHHGRIELPSSDRQSGIIPLYEWRNEVRSKAHSALSPLTRFRWAMSYASLEHRRRIEPLNIGFAIRAVHQLGHGASGLHKLTCSNKKLKSFKRIYSACSINLHESNMLTQIENSLDLLNKCVNHFVLYIYSM